MKRLPPFRMSFLGNVSCAAIAALTACGGISDPSRGSDGTVATVTGALTGTNVPANTRVALVWRVGNSGSYAVGSDVAVTNGSFTMDLAAPSNSYFFETSNDGYSSEAPSSGAGEAHAPAEDTHAPTPVDAGANFAPPTPTPPSGEDKGFAFANKVTPRDAISGQISKPLAAAVAGFVVYVDTNGNGKLDITGQYAASTDEVIGGNKELMLTYLRDGGTLDYEKLRDSSSILPKAGYNLMWTDEKRWVPLDAVDLKITNRTKLPSGVCNSYSYSYSEEDVPPNYPSPPPVATVSDGGTTTSGYPNPNDPTLRCSDDGRSYYVEYGGCAPEPPTPVGLCSLYDDGSPVACASGGGGPALGPGQPVPEGWPCPVAVDAGVPTVDAGVPNDGG